MASAVFAGNVVNENDQPLDVWYQTYHVQQNKFSNIRRTQFSQYSIDLADSTWLTNTNSATNNNEQVLIIMWDGDGTSRNGLKDRLGVFLVNLNLNNVYLRDAKIIPKVQPVSGFNAPTQSTTGTNVSCVSTASDIYQWTYASSQFRQTNFWFTNIFNSVGNLTITYDFGNSAGFVSASSVVYPLFGIYTITQRVQNQYGLIHETQKQITIKKNAPVPGINFTPSQDYAVKTTQNIRVHANIQDHNSTITQIQHIILKNNSVVNSVTNTNLFNYVDYIIPEYGVYVAKQIISYNNGFDDLSIEFQKEIKIGNWPPTCSFQMVKMNDTTLRFIPEATDQDGTVTQYIYSIYMQVPFSSIYSLVKEDPKTNPDPYVVEFPFPGNYRMLLRCVDNLGAYDEFFMDFSISASPGSLGSAECDVVILDSIFFIFPEVI